MPTLANSRAAPPKSWDEFEDIVCSSAKSRWKHPNFTRHGRLGQSQSAVDVYGRDEHGQSVGLQCKNTWDGLTTKMIDTEVANAQSFKPALTTLYIVITADTEKKIQAFVRTLSERRKATGDFNVEILFWTDVWQDLTMDERRVYQHFPHLKATASTEPQAPSHDQHLFQNFQSIFAYKPAVRLLREHDFGGPFHCKSIQPLYDFIEKWDQPEKEFLDKDLQASLAVLYDAAQALSAALVKYTVHVGNGECASVFSDSARAMGPRPDLVIEETLILNDQASQFVPIYERFLRLCQEKAE